MASKAAKPPRVPRVSPAPANEHSIEPVATTVAAIAAPAEEPIMDTAATTVIDQTKTAFADATERAKGGFAKGQQMVGEMGEFGKGNVEAMVESSKIAAKGMEQFGQSAVAYVRASFEEAQVQARTLASAGSPTEFLKLQGDFMRTSFDRMIAETSKNTEAMLKLAGEVAQPISNRMALAADRFKVAA